mmetsp:Transcript_24628/g.18657  ORF Transcript_24628/g.18657 Transcript_24628/m.18657 type:complete len:262 (-) Transcript_24628:34-819(-)
MGFIIATIGLLSAIIVILIDAYNEKQVRRVHLYLVESGFISQLIPEEVELSLWETIKGLKLEFWAIICLVVLDYATFTPFFTNESLMIRERFQFSAVEAGRLMALAGGVMIVLIPLIGHISDKANKRGFQLMFAITILFASHLYLTLIPDCDQCHTVILPLVTIQIGYGIFITGIWPAGRQCLSPESKGVCIGMMNAAQNIAYSISPLVIGWVLDNSENYSLGFIRVSQVMMSCLAASFTILTIWWIKGMNILNPSKTVIS